MLINIKLFVNFTFFRPFPCTYLSFILLFYFFLSFSIFFCLFFSSLRKYFSIFYILFSVKSSTCFSLNIPFIFYQKFCLFFVKYYFYFPSHILFRKLFNKSDRFCHFLPNLQDQTCPFPKKQHEFTGKQNGKTWFFFFILLFSPPLLSLFFRSNAFCHPPPPPLSLCIFHSFSLSPLFLFFPFFL